MRREGRYFFVAPRTKQALTVLAEMTLRLACILALSCATTALGDDASFTKSLPPQDFSAAGLDKLTPAELNALDALVHARQAGAVAVAKDETAKEVENTVRVRVQAEDQKSEEKKASAGFIDRMKVMLKPGTEIGYTTLDSTILLPYDGYEVGTVFTLSNGQRWQVLDSSDYEGAAKEPVPVHIVPGSMGSFFMEIERGGRPRVKFVGNVMVIPAKTLP
jgi:hypothetical protein